MLVSNNLQNWIKIDFINVNPIKSVLQTKVLLRWRCRFICRATVECANCDAYKLRHIAYIKSVKPSQSATRRSKIPNSSSIAQLKRYGFGSQISTSRRDETFHRFYNICKLEFLRWHLIRKPFKEIGFIKKMNVTTSIYIYYRYT